MLFGKGLLTNDVFRVSAKGGRMRKSGEKNTVAEAKAAMEGRNASKEQKQQDMQDIVEKEFISFPDIAADVINAFA